MKLTIDEWRVHVDEKLSNIGDDIKDIKEAILGFDNRFASKKTEKTVDWMIRGLIVGAFGIIAAFLLFLSEGHIVF